MLSHSCAQYDHRINRIWPKLCKIDDNFLHIPLCFDFQLPYVFVQKFKKAGKFKITFFLIVIYEFNSYLFFKKRGGGLGDGC